MTGAAEHIRYLLANFENVNPNGTVALWDNCEDSETLHKIFLKDSLEMEKMFTELAIWIPYMLFVHTPTRTFGTDVTLSSSFILTLIYFEWRHRS